MKNLFLNTIFLGLFLITGMTLQAQPPVKFNYQGIARATDGSPLANQALGLRISILDGSPTGTVQFVETHTATTNAYGLYTLSIGGGTAVTGTIMSPTWPGTGTFIKVEIDPAGGVAYVDAGTSELKYVPYSIMSNFSVAADQARRLTLFGSANNVLTHDGTNWTAAPGLINTNGTRSTVLNTTKNQLVVGDPNLSVGNDYVAINAKIDSAPELVMGYRGIVVANANNTKVGNNAAIVAANNGTFGLGLYAYAANDPAIFAESNSGSTILAVNRTSVGYGLISYAHGASGKAVVGIASSGGIGVEGTSTISNGVSGKATTGTGVSGEASSTGLGVYGSGKIGVWAQANEAQAPAIALQVTGAVKATGSNKFAYRTGVTTVAVGEFTLSHANQAATDIIMVTPVHTDNTLTAFPGYFLNWNGTNWKIYNASDDATPLLFPIGTSFNVIVIRL
jgi:hypothetical protein